MKQEIQDGVRERAEVMLRILVDEDGDLFRRALFQHSRLLSPYRLASMTPSQTATYPNITLDATFSAPVHHAAFPDRRERLPFETGKSGVPAQESYHQQQPPARIELEPFGERRHQEPDQKRAGHVDDQRSERKLPAEARHDGGGRHIACRGPVPPPIATRR